MTYKFPMEVNEEKNPDIHLKYGEKMDVRGSYYVVVPVTACAWTGASEGEITLDIELVTCPHCLKRKQNMAEQMEQADKK